MTDKQIIKKFSDNHCLVLENNQISLREDEITAYRIILGKSTNELLEFIKDTYLRLKRKEQECEALQMSDNEAGEIVAELKAECKELKEKVKELNQGWIDCDKERNLQEANSEFRQRVINRYKRTLTEIKDMCSEMNCESLMQNSWCGNTDFKMGCCEKLFKKQILQKISEVLKDE